MSGKTVLFHTQLLCAPRLQHWIGLQHRASLVVELFRLLRLFVVSILNDHLTVVLVDDLFVPESQDLLQALRVQVNYSTDLVPDFKQLIGQWTHLFVHDSMHLLDVEQLVAWLLLEGVDDFGGCGHLLLVVSIDCASSEAVIYNLLDCALRLFGHPRDEDAFDCFLLGERVLHWASLSSHGHVFHVQHPSVLARQVVAHVAHVQLSLVHLHHWGHCWRVVQFYQFSPLRLQNWVFSEDCWHLSPLLRRTVV